MTGISELETRHGIHLVQLDLEADPAKRSAEAQAKLHVGYDDRMFRKEYKRDWTIASGKPIYEGAFDRERHVAKEPFEVDSGTDILLGFDFGLQPACVWTRTTPRGGLQIIRELITWNGRGSKQTQDTAQLGDAMLILNGRFFPACTFDAYVDPAGFARSQADSTTCVEVLQREKYGLRSVEAGPVSWKARYQAMRDALNQMRGDEPLIQLDPSCTMLIEGFLSAYKYREVGPEGRKELVDEAEKNAWSHIMNALEYVVGALFYGLFKDQHIVEVVEPYSAVALMRANTRRRR